MVACDVGQGDALLLHTGPHSAVAVDTGPDPTLEDACLRRFGITRVVLAVLTHFHADHIGGLSGLLNGREVDAIEATTLDDPPAGAAEVTRLASAARVPLRRVAPGERDSFGPVSWRVLWPDAALPFPSAPAQVGTAHTGPDSGAAGPGHGGPEGSAPNNASIVIAVTFAQSGPPLTALLTGDIESPVQAALLAAHRAELRATILKVPHHGSANQAPGFAAAVDPRVSVISVGAHNPYGHPAARTVRLVGEAGARVYRTDLDGDITLGTPDNPADAVAVSAQRGDGTPGGKLPTDPLPAASHRPSHSHHTHRTHHPSLYLEPPTRPQSPPAVFVGSPP